MSDIDVEKLISPRALAAVRSVGLHKVAAAMAGLDEITLKEAAGLIGARAYMRRKEAATVANSIGALAELRGEKVANLSELLRRSFMPTVAGAGLAMVPDLMAEGPLNTDKALQHALVGGALGLGGGMAHNINFARQNNPGAWDSLMQSLPPQPGR